MSISSTTRKAGPFTGNDSTTVFPFAFKVFADTDIRVVRLTADVEVDLVLNSHFTVALNADQDASPGGNVTLTGALATGSTLTITSDLPALQPMELTNAGGFFPRVLNDSADRSVILLQQLQEQLGRALKLPISSTAVTELAGSLANTVLGFDADGAPVTLSPNDLRGPPGAAGGVGSLLAVATDLAATVIPAPMTMFRTRGYYEDGDGGSADYVKVDAEPAHPGKLQSADGAWWELRETIINPTMFGAKADGSTYCDDAFNAMSDYCKAVANVAEIRLGVDPRGANAEYWPNSYRFAVGWTNRPAWLRLDPGSTAFGTSPALKISGWGAIIYLDQEDACFVKWLPQDQSEAAEIIGWTRPVLEGFTVIGSGPAGFGQRGIVIGATYGLVIRDCDFLALDHGVNLLFCLSAELSNVQTHGCYTYPFTAESGEPGLTTLTWDGATNSNSASNITVFDKCRVYGYPTEAAAIGIYASDSVRIRNFVAEGNGGEVGIHYDYGGSTTCKLFTVEGCHFENPNVKLLMRIRAAGVVSLKGIYYQYPAALIDLSDSATVNVRVEDMPYLVPDAIVDADNPNQRLFFHSNGGGRGGDEGGNSAGTIWRFISSTPGALYATLTDPASWENATLPSGLLVEDMVPTDDAAGSQFHNSGPRIEVADVRGLRLKANVSFEPDDTYDMGRSGLARPKTLNLGTGGIAAANASLRNSGDLTCLFSASIANGTHMGWTGNARLYVGADLIYQGVGQVERLRVSSSTGHITPGADNTQNLGSASLRVKEVFAGTGTINTSDARLKTEVRPLEERERTAARALLAEIGLFKFLASIAAKGDGARLHAGMTVQRAMEIMEANDLDPFAYGFICYDAWEAEAELRGEEETIWTQPGEGDDPETFTPQEVILPAPILRQACEAGDLYSFRTDELILFMVAGLGADVAAILASLETP